MAKIDDEMRSFNKMSITKLQLEIEIEETAGRLNELRNQEKELGRQMRFFYNNRIKEITRDGEVIPMTEGDEI